MRSPQPDSGKKNLDGEDSGRHKPPAGGRGHGHTRSIFAAYKNQVSTGNIPKEETPRPVLQKKRKSYIGMGSNHAVSKKSSNQGSQGSNGDIAVINKQSN